MSSIGLSSDPHVQYLQQVLDEIRQGYTQIPRFQRPFIWNWERRLDLFRSIRQGIPMGAIMVWRTTSSSISCYRQFGHLSFRAPAKSTSHQYLLDGVQRLSTLLDALYQAEFELVESNPTDNSEESLFAYFDFEADDFIALPEPRIQNSQFLPLPLLLDSVELLRFQRKLSHPSADEWIARSDSIAKAFREYKVPVIPIVTEDINLASQTFQRINSSGVQMSEKHMIHALSWSNEFDLLEQIEIMREQLRDIGWNNIDDDLILKVIKVALNLDVYRSSVEEVSKAIRGNYDISARCVELIQKTAEFLERDCLIPHADLVPYAMQIVCATAAFSTSNLAPTTRDALRKWLWTSTYTEYFTGLSGDRVTRIIEEFRHAAHMGTASPIHPDNPDSIIFMAKDKFDPRTARSKATLLAFARIMNESTGTWRGSQLLRSQGRQAALAVLPKSTFRDMPKLYASNGNRFLLDPSELRDFRNSLLRGELWPSDSAAHCISTEDLEKIRQGKMVEFVLSRNRAIAEVEGKFLAAELTGNDENDSPLA